MSNRNVVILGRGTLAIQIATWFNEHSNIVAIVPCFPESSWMESLSTWAISNKIPVIESGNYLDIDSSIKIDLAFSVYYDKIINQNFINRCESIVNIHNAPLPAYRGVRPINWALKNNEKSHGVTIHKINNRVDEGDILGKIIFPIYPEIEEVEDVYKKSLCYGWSLFLDVIEKFDYAYKNAIPQQGISSCYSSKQNVLLGDRSHFRREYGYRD
jgi:methionyl-tRNA formyltransferase